MLCLHFADAVSDGKDGILQTEILGDVIILVLNLVEKKSSLESSIHGFTSFFQVQNILAKTVDKCW